MLHAGACRFISFLFVLMHEKCFHGAFQISWINWLHCVASTTSYVIKIDFLFIFFAYQSKERNRE